MHMVTLISLMITLSRTLHMQTLGYTIPPPELIYMVDFVVYYDATL